ncbi:hypothetical protein D3C72_1191230 [compost metagenome]
MKPLSPRQQRQNKGRKDSGHPRQLRRKISQNKNDKSRHFCGQTNFAAISSLARTIIAKQNSNQYKNSNRSADKGGRAHGRQRTQQTDQRKCSKTQSLLTRFMGALPLQADYKSNKKCDQMRSQLMNNICHKVRISLHEKGTKSHRPFAKKQNPFPLQKRVSTASISRPRALNSVRQSSPSDYRR